MFSPDGCVATRDCEVFPVLYFFMLGVALSLVNQYLRYRAWSSFLLAFFHMRILSVILVSASRYVIVIVNFCKFIRFIVFSLVWHKVLFVGSCKSVTQLYPELPYRSCKYSFSCNFCPFSQSFVVLYVIVFGRFSVSVY